MERRDESSERQHYWSPSQRGSKSHEQAEAEGRVREGEREGASHGNVQYHLKATHNPDGKTKTPNGKNVNEKRRLYRTARIIVGVPPVHMPATPSSLKVTAKQSTTDL